MSREAIHRCVRRRIVPLAVLAALLLCMMPAYAVGADDVITCPDHNLEAAIRDVIVRPTGDIHQSDLDGLTELTVGSRGIKDLTGLEHCANLVNLSLAGNQVSDISPLSGLTKLTHLYLASNQISDISPLSGLTRLTHLRLGGNQISDLSPLSGLTNLTDLRLGSHADGGNLVADISPLSGLTSLTSLYLARNHISDISPLSGLTSLTSLGLGSNLITDISPVSGLTNLQMLSFGRIVFDGNQNQVSDISSLSGLTNLTDLRLPYNQVSDVSPLSGLTKLTALDLGTNEIGDISPLSGLTKLEQLWINNNQIADVSFLAGFTALTALELNNNRIGDISPLSGLTRITFLKCSTNQITDISPLSGLTKLTTLYLYKNQISDLGPLVNNPGMAKGDVVYLYSNPLNADSLGTCIPTLQGRGVTVCWDASRDDPPIQPANLSPAAGAAGITLTPTMQSSPFCQCNLGASHAASQWRITTTAGDYAHPFFDSAPDSSNLTMMAVPAGRLQPSVTYYWQVRHQSDDDWSDWSTETSFTTVPAADIQGLDPASGRRRQDVIVLISGSNFEKAEAVGFGPGITVSWFIVNSGTEITAEIIIDADATEGTRDISIRTGAGVVTRQDGFTVTGGGGICSGGLPATPAAGGELTTTLAAISLLFGLWYWLVRRGWGRSTGARSHCLPVGGGR